MRHDFIACCLWAALAANTPSALFAQAAEPRATEPRIAEPRTAQPRTAGTVLLLTTDRVLEGDIVQIGDQYRIRRGTAETVVTAGRVKRLCADWAETLAYVRSQANLGDPDERLRLARWCQLHNLREEAVAEARIAAEMRPTHPETGQLLQILQRAPAGAQAMQQQPLSQPLSHQPAASQPAASQPAPAVLSASASKFLPHVDLSADGLAAFNTRVQPILMNLCANCHTGNDAGGFRLHRAFENGARAAAQRNLAAVMAHLDLERPAASSLLAKAVSVHGSMSQPPVRDRRAVPFLTLQHWVEHVAANNPHLRQQAVAAPAFPRLSAEPATLAVAPAATPTAPNRFPDVISRPLPRVEPPAPAAPGSAALGSAATPVGTIVIPAPTAANRAAPSAPPAASNDPFDPALFNRPR
jgi:hypothetical protein